MMHIDTTITNPVLATFGEICYLFNKHGSVGFSPCYNSSPKQHSHNVHSFSLSFIAKTINKAITRWMLKSNEQVV